MKRACLAVLQLVLAGVIVQGCAGLYSKVNKTFSDGLDAASTIINTDLEQRSRVDRIYQIAAMVYAGTVEPVQPDEKKAFVKFVCNGAERYKTEREALGILKAYSRTIGEIAQAPAGEIGALAHSIIKWVRTDPNFPQFPPSDAGQGTERKEENDKPKLSAKPCYQQFETENLLPPLPLLEVPLKILVTPAQLFLLRDFLKALEAAGVAILRIIDEAVRTEELRRFVQGSQKTIAAIFEKGVTAEALERALIERKRVALLVPYHQFLAMRKLNPVTNRAQIFEMAVTIHANLAEFDVLSERAPSGALLNTVKAAQADLVRLSNGELTAEQALGVLLGFARSMITVVEKIEAAEKEAEKVAKVVRG